ncbi:MAG: response regulator [Proteobacteria bacterium]|nr:response regulator [Pseudomonadota bacterium]
MDRYEHFANDRILVIDDNEEVHHDFRTIFKKKKSSETLSSLKSELFGEEMPDCPEVGFEIDSALNGEDGYEKVKTAKEAGRPYAVAFVDMRMPPGWDGLETIEHVWKVDPELEIVICTAYSDYTWTQIADRLGATMDSLLIIKKPFDIIEVLQIATATTKRWQLKKVAELKQEELEKIVEARTKELMQAKDALQKSEEAAKALLNAPNTSALLVNGQGEIVSVNESVCSMLGKEMADLENALVYEVLPDLQGSSALLKKKINEVLCSGNNVGFENQSKSKILGYSIYPISEIDEKVTSLAIYIRDITETRRMQASLAQADRMASMGLLAAGVAHEINNPLTYILNNLENLKEDVPRLIEAMKLYSSLIDEQVDDEKVPQSVHMARAEFTTTMLDDLLCFVQDATVGATRVRQIVRDLSSFSRTEGDKHELIQVNKVMESVTNMAYNEVKYRAHLIKDYGKVPTIIANAGKLSQVFLNLVVNAAQSIDEGAADDNEIRIRTYVKDEKLTVEISDTGKGISTENLEHLFDPFFTTRAGVGGTGLGLSICHRIIHSYEGTIEVKSELGKGSSFFIKLPMPQPEELISLQPSSQMDNQATRKVISGRILIVDDEKMIRVSMGRMLSREHNVVLAESGREAMEILGKDTAFDLIICDIMMPDITGIDLYLWLQKQCPDLARWMVFMTGGAFTPKTIEFLSSTSNLQLEKPFDPKHLKTLIHNLLNPPTRRSIPPEATNS